MNSITTEVEKALPSNLSFIGLNNTMRITSVVMMLPVVPGMLTKPSHIFFFSIAAIALLLSSLISEHKQGEMVDKKQNNQKFNTQWLAFVSFISAAILPLILNTVSTVTPLMIFSFSLIGVIGAAVTLTTIGSLNTNPTTTDHRRINSLLGIDRRQAANDENMIKLDAA